MKTITKLFLTLVAGSMLMLVSCKNEAAAVVNPSTSGTTTGTWKVSLFFDNADETSNFNGYTFTFNTNGQVSAVNGSSTKTGTWSETSTRLNINFGSDALMGDLNGNWLIVEKTAATIKLKDDNPAQDDRLEFVKL